MTCNPYTLKTMKTDFFILAFVFEEFLNWSIESLSWEKVKLWKVFLPSILSSIRKQMFVLLFLFLLLIEKDQFRGSLESKYKAIILFIELVREELSRRGSDWQYIFEMEHLTLLPTKPSLIEGRYPTVGHFEGKMFSSWACEPGCYSTKPVLKWITCPIANYLSSKMPNCQYSREVVGISFYQLEVEFYV